MYSKQVGRGRKVINEGLEIITSHINSFGLYKLYVPEYDFMTDIKPNVLANHILKDEPSKLMFVAYMLEVGKKLQSILDTLVEEEKLDITKFYDCINLENHPYRDEFKFKPDYRVRFYNFVSKEEAQTVVKFILEAQFYIHEEITRFLHIQKMKKITS